MVYHSLIPKFNWRWITAAAMWVLLLTSMVACKNDQNNRQIRTRSFKEVLDSASHLFDLGKEAEALKFVDDSFTSIAMPGVFERWQRYNFKALYYLNYHRDYRKAMSYTDSMINIMMPKRFEFKEEYAASLFTKGDVYRSGGNYEKAFDYYFEAKKFAIKQLDDCRKSELSYRM